MIELHPCVYLVCLLSGTRGRGLSIFLAKNIVIEIDGLDLGQDMVFFRFV